MMNLNPCPYRHVGDEGHIVCDKIKTGDREVSPNICRACPVSQINCGHLRATLDHQGHAPVVVRWGNGKTQVWDDQGPSITFRNAACAEKVIPIHSGKECAGCQLRQPLLAVQAMARPAPAERRPAPTRAARAAANQPAPALAVQPIITKPVAPTPPAPVQSIQPLPPPPAPDARSSIVAQKIIQLQEWLNRAKNPGTAEPEAAVKPIQYESRPAPRAVGEERRTGWTD